MCVLFPDGGHPAERFCRIGREPLREFQLAAAEQVCGLLRLPEGGISFSCPDIRNVPRADRPGIKNSVLSGREREPCGGKAQYHETAESRQGGMLYVTDFGFRADLRL